jgi:glycosyltransferase involved in cell wall biosynthesis
MNNQTSNQRKITVLIPCHNEEAGIAHVVKAMPIERLENMGFATEIIVIDNNSTDKTADVCRSLGIRVVFEGKKGKGNAMRAGFSSVSDDTDFVVMLDGDDTYKPEEIVRLIEPLASNFGDVIVGSRFGGKMMDNALKLQNRIVNWMFTFLVRQFYKANVTDVLSGYFAWKKNVVDSLNMHLSSEGFSLEMEMITKTAKLGFEMYSVPITYDVRKGETKISAIKDGMAILYTFSKNIFWKPNMKDALAQYPIKPEEQLISRTNLSN